MSLLQGLGYSRARYYPGGLEDWQAGGGRLESLLPPEPTRASAPPAKSRAGRWIFALADRSFGELAGLWLAIIGGCGLLFWLAGLWPSQALCQGGAPLDFSLGSLITSIYFSFVTALSIGYGDVIPMGFMRGLAVAEGCAGLLVFSCVVSKLVSQRQEELVQEIHRIAFEERLERVQTNLHLVLSELQGLLDQCSGAAGRSKRLMARVESTINIFRGELRTVHDLLYRPQQTPEESVLESILISLELAFRELLELLECGGEETAQSPSLRKNLKAIGVLASEICGECVPRQYAPNLKAWMDRIQGLARLLN